MAYGLVYTCNAAGCSALKGPASWPGFPPGTQLFTWQALGVYVGWILAQVPVHLLPKVAATSHSARHASGSGCTFMQPPCRRCSTSCCRARGCSASGSPTAAGCATSSQVRRMPQHTALPHAKLPRGPCSGCHRSAFASGAQAFAERGPMHLVAPLYFRGQGGHCQSYHDGKMVANSFSCHSAQACAT